MTEADGPVYSPARRAAAWGVHLYTAMGLPLVFFATLALAQEQHSVFFLLLGIAVAVDATDGFFARAVRVWDVLPHFSGRKLDDLVDFLSFAFLPSIALPALGLLPAGWEALAVVPLMASGYGFCQDKAKTDDAFVGFPSYWNIVVLYLYVFQWSPWANAALILTLSVLIFVPLHYVYPTKTRMLRPLTIGLGLVWGITLLVLCVYPRAPWSPTAAWASMAYVAYYVAISVVHHRRIHRAL